MVLRVGVMGAGAIGCYAGGMLVAAGVDVVFVGRGRLKAELEKSGLTLSDLEGGTTRVEPAKIQFATEARALADRDVVLCAVKSGQTEEVGRELAGILRDDAIVVSLQNGVRNPATLRAVLGARAVLGGIVAFNVVSLKEGRFRRATSGPLVIEKSDDPRIAELARAFESRGLEIELPRTIEPIQWSKLVINLNNAISALSNLPTAKLLFDTGYRRILAATMEESVKVLEAANIPLRKLGPLPVRVFPTLLRMPTPLFRVLARTQLKVDPDAARSSMWEDLAAGRNTEVDYLNGEIVRVAEQSGGDAPLNRNIVELIHEVESKKSGSPKLTAEALWSRINAR